MLDDKIPSFSTMLRTALGESLAPDATSFIEWFDEQGVMEFPFAPPGGVSRIEGRPALVEYLSGLGAVVDIESMTEPVVHRTVTPDTVILEFKGVARGVVTGGRYEQTYISVIRTSGGRIVHYRDYWNPTVLTQVAQDAQAASHAQAGGDVGGR